MAEIGNVTVRVDAVITDEQYREAMGAVRAANERMDLLEDENAKLRELVMELYEDQCDECDEWKYRDRMRELGIKMGGAGIED